MNQSKFDLFGGYMTDCVDAFIFNEASLFQSVLDETSEAIKTSYACLMLNGRLIAASNAWNELNSAEKYLISLLTLTLNPSTSYDIPIYLPYKSPRVCFDLFWIFIFFQITKKKLFLGSLTTSHLHFDFKQCCFMFYLFGKANCGFCKSNCNNI